MRSIWDQAWLDRGWRKALFFGMVFLVPLIHFLPACFLMIYSEPGILLYDPVLDLIGPFELSKITFAVLYSFIAIGIALLLRSPYRIVRMLHAYGLLLFMRMITMYVITLEAPFTAIPLVD